jgi:hypothetical protein
MHRLKPQYFNLQEILNRKVGLSSFRDDSILQSQMPIHGEILSRELVSWEKDWYVIKLNRSLEIYGKSSEYLLVKLKSQSNVILSQAKQVIEVRLILDLELLKNKKKIKRDFPFVDYAVLDAL